MSSIESVIAALVEAQRAQEDLPKVRAELDTEQAANSRLRDHIAGLEIKIANLRDELSAAQTKTQEVTKERDEAMFRELEASDIVSHARRVLAQIKGEIVDFTDATSPAPVKVEPEPLPQSAPEASPVPKGEDLASAGPFVSSTESQSQPVSSAPSGVSVAETGGEHSDLAPVVTGLNQPAPAQVPRYAGMAYWSKPDDVSWQDFVANGGEAAPWAR